MSKLEELIQELCPNGVEYKRLGDIATISRGGSFQKKDFSETGIPCIHYGQIYTKYNLFADKTICCLNEVAGKKAKYAEQNDIVMAVTSENVDDVCKCVAWIGKEKIAVSGHTAIIHHNQNAKYLSYYFHSIHFFKQKVKLAHGTKVIEVTPDKLNEVQLPVPPLEVQREIVHILDKFTFLSAELTAELTARKKQYEFYRDNLLTFKESAKKYVLGDIATVTKLAGFEFTKYVIYSENGNIIALRGLNVKNGKLNLEEVKYIDNSDLSKLSRSKLHIGDMLFTYVGTIGQVALIDEEDKYYLAPNVALIRCNKEIMLPEYMRYYFQSNQFWDKQISRLLQSSSMKNIPMEKIRKFEIVVPSMSIQKKIVEVLDNFDAICNDLNIGFPAEIEARKKQYEYYRDMLLTFPEYGNTILTDRQTDVLDGLIKLYQYVFGFAYVSLGNIATDIYRGAGIKRDEVTKEGIPCVRYGEIYTMYDIAFSECVSHTKEEVVANPKYFEHGDIIFAITGESIEEISKSIAYLGYEKCMAGGDTVVMKHNQEPRYMSYVLSTTSAQIQKSKGKVKSKVVHSSVPALKEIVIPLPSLERQKQIADILDNFHQLCNDISVGIPAEIEARRKQYEYYRDKLLTFKELSK